MRLFKKYHAAQATVAPGKIHRPVSLKPVLANTAAVDLIKTRNRDGEYKTHCKIWGSQQKTGATYRRAKLTQPRNEKCNCGSGLKYKKCCIPK